MNTQLIVMAERQAPLAKIYLQDPAKAMITDSASSQCIQMNGSRNRLSVNSA
jgi:hypothetical protein